MMFQAYFLTIGYLLLNAGLLLGDEYGGQFLLLLRLRNTVRASIPLHIVFIVLGVLLAIWKIILPIPPGPTLLGDLIPVCCLLVVVIYHVTQLHNFTKSKKRNDMQDATVNDSIVFTQTRSYIEIHKQNLGYLILGVALLHFLFPSAVLL